MRRRAVSFDSGRICNHRPPISLPFLSCSARAACVAWSQQRLKQGHDQHTVYGKHDNNKKASPCLLLRSHEHVGVAIDASVVTQEQMDGRGALLQLVALKELQNVLLHSRHSATTRKHGH